VVTVPESEAPEKSSAPPPTTAAPRAPGRRVTARRLLAVAGAVLVVALLFLAYLRVSRTYPENSDESNDLLMAWDMLHGNVLLHGWYLSDVSFITTELPQYALLVWLFGLHTDTAHIAAAMTYTLVVIFSVLLARGRAPRREARLRMLLTAALVFAPQLGVGVFVLLLSLGHIGTAVPLLLTWLVIDRCPARWFVPVAVGLLLTWVLIADPLVLLVGVVPLVTVCAMRVARALARRKDATVLAVLRARWYELSLAVAAIAAQGLASLAGRLLQAYLHPVPYQLAPAHTWPGHAWVTAKGLLALFGAKPAGPPAAFAFALLHLAGVALVAWAMLRVARRFPSWPDMISQILLVAMVVNVVAYVPSTLASATDLNAREFAVVLPFGAVLAGRTLAAPLLAGPRRRPPAPWRRICGSPRAPCTTPGSTTQTSWSPAARPGTSTTGSPTGPRWRRWDLRPGRTAPALTPCTSGTRTSWLNSPAGDRAGRRHARDAVVSGQRDVALACGSANIRGRERVRRHVHLPRAAPALARRGGALPVPARGVMGPQQQRLPQERGPALPRRGQPSGVRHPGVR
jgi:hypothetical protein